MFPGCCAFRRSELVAARLRGYRGNRGRLTGHYSPVENRSRRRRANARHCARFGRLSGRGREGLARRGGDHSRPAVPHRKGGTIGARLSDQSVADIVKARADRAASASARPDQVLRSQQVTNLGFRRSVTRLSQSAVFGRASNRQFEFPAGEGTCPVRLAAAPSVRAPRERRRERPVARPPMQAR